MSASTIPSVADAGCREVERCGGAEPARADQENARVEQLELTLLADLRDQDVARVTRTALRRQRPRHRDLEAVALPVGEPTGK